MQIQALFLSPPFYLLLSSYCIKNLLYVFHYIVLPINVVEKQIDVAEEMFYAYPTLVYL